MATISESIYVPEATATKREKERERRNLRNSFARETERTPQKNVFVPRERQREPRRSRNSLLLPVYFDGELLNNTRLEERKM